MLDLEGGGILVGVNRQNTLEHGGMCVGGGGRFIQSLDYEGRISI